MQLTEGRANGRGVRVSRCCREGGADHSRLMSDDEQKRKPWFKFWPSDWLGDEKLRVCSLAARGFWIECLALMHKAEPYGHLLVNGIAPTMQELGKLVAATAGETSRMLDELKTKGVCSVTDAGVIFSRRMVRDKAKEQKASADGKRGGNPVLKNTDKSTLKGAVNGSHKHTRTDARVPDSIFQNSQVQEHRAEDVAECAQPVEKPSHSHLCALVREEWKAGRVGSGDDVEDMEHLKTRAARLKLAYTAEALRKAIDAVQHGRKARAS
jgi:hypothetical protein